MLAICSGNRLSLVLGLVIQYLSGEGTFSGRRSPRVIILNSNSGGVVVGGRLGRTTSHRSHVNIPHSWRIPASRQGFNVLFCFIHKGRSVHLFQRVFGVVGGCLPVLAGVWRCWRALDSPHVVWMQGWRWRACVSLCVCMCVSLCV